MRHFVERENAERKKEDKFALQNILIEIEQYLVYCFVKFKVLPDYLIMLLTKCYFNLCGFCITDNSVRLLSI